MKKYLKILILILITLLCGCNKVYVTGTAQIINIDYKKGSIEVLVRSMNTADEPQLSTIKADTGDLSKSLNMLLYNHPEVLLSSASLAITDSKITKSELLNISQIFSNVREISPKLRFALSDNINLEKLDPEKLSRIGVVLNISTSAGTELYRIQGKLASQSNVMLPKLDGEKLELLSFILPDICELDRDTAQLLPQNIVKLPTIKKNILGSVVRITYISYNLKNGLLSVNVGTEITGSPTDTEIDNIATEIAILVKNSINSVTENTFLSKALYGDTVTRHRIRVIVER